MDPAARRLWRIGAAPGLSVVRLAGDHVAWSTVGTEPQRPEQNSFVVARWKV